MSTVRVLGTIGVVEENFGSGEFNDAGLPELEEKIKLSVEKIRFSNKSLKEYNRSVLQEDNKLKVVDSLDLKPHFFEMEISDKVGMIEALNNEANKNIRGYLEATGNNSVLTSVFIYFPPEVASAIDNATEVYLINNKKNSYSLELLNSDKSIKVLDFNEGVTFSYVFSDFCWKQNRRRQSVIAALRDKNASCPGNTEKNPEKLRSEDLFEKL